MRQPARSGLRGRRLGNDLLYPAAMARNCWAQFSRPLNATLVKKRINCNIGAGGIHLAAVGEVASEYLGVERRAGIYRAAMPRVEESIEDLGLSGNLPRKQG